MHRFGRGADAAAAVDGLDLTVAAGEVFGLLGPNGAGKTTTLRVVNTLLPVQEGRVAVFVVNRDPSEPVSFSTSLRAFGGTSPIRHGW